MKKAIIYSVAFIGSVLLVVLIMSGTPAKQKAKKIETITFVCNTASYAKTWMDAKIKEGFQVQHLMSQSVSVALDGKQFGRSLSVRGDIIIIMTKEIYD